MALLKNGVQLLLSITLLGLIKAQPCRNFPKIIGGGSGNTNINQIDVFLKGDALAFGGDSSDPTIAAYLGTTVPIVGVTSI
jgi:hypothetical protein